MTPLAAERLLDAALEYLADGRPVVPVAEDKRPLVEWGRYRFTPQTEADVRGMPWPAAHGLATLTWPASDFMHLDFDGPHARTAWAGTGIDLPSTARVRTRSGGEHLVFRVPPDTPRPHPDAINRDLQRKIRLVVAGVCDCGKRCGVDLLLNGYAVAPPTPGYAEDPDFPLDGSLAVLPADVLTLARARHRAASPPNGNGGGGEYANMLAGVLDGGRHDASCRLAGHYAHMGLPEAETWEILSGWCTRCEALDGVPVDRGKVRDTVRDIYRAEARERAGSASPDTPPPAGASFTLRRVAVDELDLERPPLCQYLLHPIIPEGAIGLLVARWGLLKTWCLLDLALAGILGGTAWGRFAFERAVRVLLVDEENGAGLILRRLAALALGRGLTTAEFQHVTRERLRVFADSGFNFRTPGAVAALMAETEAFSPQLVLMDSLVRVQRADNENDAADSNGLFLDGLRPLARDRGTAVFLTHHMRKRAATAGLNDPGERIRGTGDLPALADQVVALVETDAPDEPLLVHIKTREADRAPDLLLKLTPGEHGGLLLTSREPGVVRTTKGEGGKASAAKAFVVASLARAGALGLKRETVIKCGMEVGLKESTIKRAIDALLAEETVVPRGPEKGAPLRLVEGV